MLPSLSCSVESCLTIVRIHCSYNGWEGRGGEGREGGREGKEKGGREGGREGRKEGGREGGMGDIYMYMYVEEMSGRGNKGLRKKGHIR